MNIWDFNYKKVRLVDIDGDSFFGYIIDISRAEDVGEKEDCVTIELRNGRIMGFYESEIKAIEALS